jgi:hypothetical protein
MENISSRQRVKLVKVSVCIQIWSTFFLSLFWNCVYTEVTLVIKHYTNTAWSIAGHFTGWDIPKWLIKNWCVANVNEFNKYFIHITVYIQLFLICTSSLYLIDMKFPTYPTFIQGVQLPSGQVHVVFCPQKSLLFPKSSPASWARRHWLCTLLPLSWCFSLQKKNSL